MQHISMTIHTFTVYVPDNVPEVHICYPCTITYTYSLQRDNSKRAYRTNYITRTKRGGNHILTQSCNVPKYLNWKLSNFLKFLSINKLKIALKWKYFPFCDSKICFQLSFTSKPPFGIRFRMF